MGNPRALGEIILLRFHLPSRRMDVGISRAHRPPKYRGNTFKKDNIMRAGKLSYVLEPLVSIVRSGAYSRCVATEFELRKVGRLRWPMVDMWRMNFDSAGSSRERGHYDVVNLSF